MWDVEGTRYVDYLGSWGPLIVGHSHPLVLERVREAAARGLSYGAPNVDGDRARRERICALFPHVERVRFTSSGTEAAMSGCAGARPHRPHQDPEVRGLLHGTADSLLVKAGSGALAFGHPSSAGVPEDPRRHTLIAQFNDLASVQALFDAYPGQIACVMVEPAAGNMNLILPKPGFLEGLRSICSKDGSLLIFDEVMTGFRVALGGMQQVSGVTPDLTAFGKVIGGGMPVGAIGGPAAVMEKMAPLGKRLPGGHAVGQPDRDGRGPRDARADLGARLLRGDLGAGSGASSPG